MRCKFVLNFVLFVQPLTLYDFSDGIESVILDVCVTCQLMNNPSTLVFGILQTVSINSFALNKFCQILTSKAYKCQAYHLSGFLPRIFSGGQNLLLSSRNFFRRAKSTVRQVSFLTLIFSIVFRPNFRGAKVSKGSKLFQGAPPPPSGRKPAYWDFKLMIKIFVHFHVDVSFNPSDTYI